MKRLELKPDDLKPVLHKFASYLRKPTAKLVNELFHPHLKEMVLALKSAEALAGNQLSPEGRQNALKRIAAAIAKAEGRE